MHLKLETCNWCGRKHTILIPLNLTVCRDCFHELNNRFLTTKKRLLPVGLIEPFKYCDMCNRYRFNGVSTLNVRYCQDCISSITKDMRNYKLQKSRVQYLWKKYHLPV